MHITPYQRLRLTRYSDEQIVAVAVSSQPERQGFMLEAAIAAALAISLVIANGLG